MDICQHDTFFKEYLTCSSGNHERRTISMRGRVRCGACGLVFDIKDSDFTFDLSSRKKSEMRCPKCKSDNIVPYFGNK